ncbi:MAG: radical SAM protein [Acidimicrobiia bacterium]
MRVLLCSTYELGHQPLGLASPASELLAAGHEVRVRDLSLDALDPADVAWADRVAISVPMHTARRLAADVARDLTRRRPDLPIAFYGLYATVATDEARTAGASAFIAGEYEDALVDWVADAGPVETVETGRRRHRIPVRADLAPLDRYARLAIAGEERPAGYVEASRGCRHRCRHCPLPTVYDGRYRIVARDVVVADALAQVERGARHLTFGDPDFLNGPAHAVRVLEAVAAAAPDVTMDVTVKVEHLLAHRDLLGAMADAGVVFVVSAFEHVDDAILEILDKGHTAADMAEAVDLVRAAGMEIRPTWLPFTPWTTRRRLADLVRFIGDHDLWGATDPVQLTIRLLLPDGSLLADHPAMVPHLVGDDPLALGSAWVHPDPGLDELAARLAELADEATGEGLCDRDVLALVVDAIAEATGEVLPSVPDQIEGIGLTESWFCCAEPTSAQVSLLGVDG